MRTLVVLGLLLASCAEQEERPYPVGMTHTTLAEVPHTAPGLSPSLRISGQLVRRCVLKFHDVEIAPNFWFGRSVLQPDDQDLLGQLAYCVTKGPLAGRTLTLGATPEPDKELAPVQHHADAAQRYLVELGVPPDHVARFAVHLEPDAGVRRDGRVDVDLAQRL